MLLIDSLVNAYIQELTVETFIANDSFINEDKNLAIITGPNNSG
jgi:DNA mismatch repair ATPase MutS